MPLSKVSVISALFVICLHSGALAQDFPFEGKVNSDNINIRSDTTVSSAVLCTVNKDDTLKVLSELYTEWYKVGLPKNTPAYINRALVVPQDSKTARVIKYAVNIRLEPNDKSPVIGKVDIGKTVNILEDNADWMKIEPPAESYGWIHKKFVDKIIVVIPKQAKDIARQNAEGIYEGRLETYNKSVGRSDLLQFVSEDGKIFLMTGDRRDLEALNGHRVRIKILKIVTPRRGLPTIYPQRIEVLD